MLVVGILAPASGGRSKVSALVSLLADVFTTSEALVAPEARVAAPKDADCVTDLEDADGIADLPHSGNALVAKNKRVVGCSPIVVAHVDVGVAKAAASHVDFHLRGLEGGQRNGLENELLAFATTDAAGFGFERTVVGRHCL